MLLITSVKVQHTSYTWRCGFPSFVTSPSSTSNYYWRTPRERILPMSFPTGTHTNSMTLLFWFFFCVRYKVSRAQQYWNTSHQRSGAEVLVLRSQAPEWVPGRRSVLRYCSHFCWSSLYAPVRTPRDCTMDTRCPYPLDCAWLSVISLGWVNRSREATIWVAIGLKRGSHGRDIWNRHTPAKGSSSISPVSLENWDHVSVVHKPVSLIL